MRSRAWVIAARYNEPKDYDIPTLPEWTVLRGNCCGIAFAGRDDADPFIRADQPMKIRR
ncbi:hypothetical protein ACNS7O_17535 (plasmid) [Haloferacaceae archaeon DSL9]